MKENPLALLAAGNLGLEAVYKWVEAVQPVLSSLVTLGQLVVAIVTVIYILRKTHLLGRSRRRKTRKANEKGLV